MTQRDPSAHEAANSGLTSAVTSTDPPDDDYAEQITAEFTSRRHVRGVSDRSLPTRQRYEP
jgi:hypothetical protein